MTDFGELKRLVEQGSLPPIVSTLIAENEQLEREQNNDAISYRAAIERQNELRAEVSGLKTGYEAYEQVNAELKAENEALADGMTRIWHASRHDAPAFAIACEFACKLRGVAAGKDAGHD
jgi:hypothetical protein